MFRPLPVNGAKETFCNSCGVLREDCRVRGIIGAARSAPVAEWEAAHLRAERAVDPLICMGCGGPRLLRSSYCMACLPPQPIA